MELRLKREQKKLKKLSLSHLSPKKTAIFEKFRKTLKLTRTLQNTDKSVIEHKSEDQIKEKKPPPHHSSANTIAGQVKNHLIQKNLKRLITSSTAAVDQMGDAIVPGATNKESVFTSKLVKFSELLGVDNHCVQFLKDLTKYEDNFYEYIDCLNKVELKDVYLSITEILVSQKSKKIGKFFERIMGF